MGRPSFLASSFGPSHPPLATARARQPDSGSPIRARPPPRSALSLAALHVERSHLAPSRLGRTRSHRHRTPARVGCSRHTRRPLPASRWIHLHPGTTSSAQRKARPLAPNRRFLNCPPWLAHFCPRLKSSRHNMLSGLLSLDPKGRFRGGAIAHSRLRHKHPLLGRPRRQSRNQTAPLKPDPIGATLSTPRGEGRGEGCPGGCFAA